MPGGPGDRDHGTDASRILIQFVGQIATVCYLRAQGRGPTLTYRMPLFPLPALVALAGWLFIFSTSETPALIYGIASLVVGVAAFLIWDRLVGRPEDRPMSTEE